MELYRHLIDDFLIEYCRKLRSKDFIIKTENLGRKKRGKREYIHNQLTRDLTSKLETHFESTVDIPRIKVGIRQSIETLINAEALLFSKYVRNGQGRWTPRIPEVSE